MTFTGRVVTGTLLVLVVSVAVLLWTADVALRRDLEGEVAVNLRREAQIVREGLPAEPAAAQAWIYRIGQETGYRITLLTPDGTVTGESDYAELPLPPIENHAARPEFRAAVANSLGVSKRRSETVGRDLMYVAIPGGPGVVRVAADLTHVDGIVHRAQLAVTVAALLALLIGGLVAWISAGSITRPLTMITEAARSIAAGQAPRFPHSGIRDIDGLVQALRQMHHELGQRFERLRHEQAESAAMVAAMVEGVVAADARGRILTANPAARQLLGYGPLEPLPELQQLFRVREAREIVRLVTEGTPVAAQEVGLDGRRLVVSARPLPTGGAILVLHDQTEVRRLEAVRRDFVANVSHELKTPLTSISGYTETLLADRPDEKTERQFLETILANAHRMQRLVDDLLDLARIESGRWQPEITAVEVEGVAREVWADFVGRAEGLGVRFATAVGDGAGTVLADPEGLRIVLRNLFDNALRYTPSGGMVTLRGLSAEDGVALQVEDTGSGIPREHLSRVFERFYRVDPSRSRMEGGTGLGLAIVRHTVEAHGGRVGVESELGAGTRVTCWFPGGVPGAVTEL
ncbi:MAG TPA: ATP-binding protein [Gemmatimonadales bacterium]|nr:ATP-binding protein [Gemmatimonadales bacterium]